MSSLVKLSNTLRVTCSIIKDESLRRKRASCEKKTKNWIFEALFCGDNSRHPINRRLRKSRNGKI